MLARKGSVSAGGMKAAAGILRELKAYDDDDSAVISCMLDAVSEVVEGDVLRKTAVGWFDEHGIEEDEDKKFGDGIANASEATPEMLTDVDFYSADYRPAVQADALVSECVERWFTPSGYMWDHPTMRDLDGNCALMRTHHHAGRKDLVVPFVLYSASQKGYRFVWAVWAVPKAEDAPGAWKAVRSPELEAAYQRATLHGGPFDLDPTWFSAKTGVRQENIPPDPVLLAHVAASHPGVSVHAFTAAKFALVRYSCPNLGAARWSPLHDTIAWLPKPELSAASQTFTPAMDAIPPPGILEYLYSRDPMEAITWTREEGGWEVGYALGEAAALLVAKCFAEPNQQDYNEALHVEVKELVRCIVDDDAAGYKAVCNALTGWALANRASACVPLLDGDLVRPLLAKVVETKLTGLDGKPPPANLAHCLEVQRLEWGGHVYVTALSGLNPTVSTHAGAVHTLSRMTHLHDDQIFWQLNRAMRMKQFGVPAHLQIDERSGPKTAGKYHLTGPAPTAFEEGPPLLRNAATDNTATLESGAWVVEAKEKRGPVTLSVKQHFTWFELGGWLLPQCLPLQYYIDKALDAASRIKGSRAPRGLVTYRGLKDVALDRAIYDTGKIVLWGAYSSTSGDRGIATAFAQSEGKAAVFSLEGHLCVCISPWSRFGREREWLYPPNSSFRVTSALSEEHAELAGKKNLQIFSMAEVDEVDALVVYMRGLVNKVVSDANSAPPEEARTMPAHVEQLFKVVLSLSEYRVTKDTAELNAALQATCDPAAQVLYTKEGTGLARKLLAMGASQFVLSSIGRAIGPTPHLLYRLVVAGAPFEGNVGALGWMDEFERESRTLEKENEDIGRSEVLGRHRAELAQMQTWDQMLTCHRDYSSLRLQRCDAVSVSGLRGERLHMNGVYLLANSPSLQNMTYFQASPLRLLANCTIEHVSPEDGTGEWVLSDAEGRAAADSNNARSPSLEGDWKIYAPAGFSDVSGHPFVEKLRTTPQAVSYYTPGEVKTEIEEMTRTIDAVRAGKKPSHNDDDDDDSDGGLQELEDMLKSISEEQPKKIEDKAIDMNLIPFPSRHRNAAGRAQTKQRFKSGTGFQFSDWRSQAVTPLVLEKSLKLRPGVRPLIIEAPRKYFTSAANMGYLAYQDPGETRRPIVRRRKGFRSPARGEIVPPCNNEALLAAQNALQKAADEVTQEHVREELLRRHRSLLAKRVLTLLRIVPTSVTLKELWDSDATGDAMERFVDEQVEKLRTEKNVKWETRLAFLPETIPALHTCVALSLKEPSTRVQPEFDPPDNRGLTPLGGQRGCINLHVGQAGCNIGAACWELLCAEHNVSPDGSLLTPLGMGDDDPSMMFEESSSGQWRPRALFVDMEPGVASKALEALKLQSLLDNEHQLQEGRYDCMDNYSEGRYGSQRHLLEPTMDKIRKLVESCDLFMGVQVTHAAGGGCGSGFLSGMLDNMAVGYEKAVIHCHTLMPSPKVKSSTLETTNWLLLQPTITEKTSLCVTYDNESLYHAALVKMGMTDPSYRDLNRIVAQSVVATSATMRMNSVLPVGGFNSISTNLVPYPRLVRVAPSLAPIFSEKTRQAFPKSRFRSLAQLASSVLHPSSLLVSSNTIGTRALAFLLNFRGDVGPMEALAVAESIKTKFTTGSQTYGCKSAITACKPTKLVDTDTKQISMDASVAVLNNSCGVGNTIRALCEESHIMFAKRAFFHHFARAGMEEGEYSEATEDMMALCRDYEEVANCDDDDEEE